jgi:hypothetical protein
MMYLLSLLLIIILGVRLWRYWETRQIREWSREYDVLFYRLSKLEKQPFSLDDMAKQNHESHEIRRLSDDIIQRTNPIMSQGHKLSLHVLGALGKLFDKAKTLSEAHGNYLQRRIDFLNELNDSMRDAIKNTQTSDGKETL